MEFFEDTIVVVEDSLFCLHPKKEITNKKKIDLKNNNFMELFSIKAKVTVKVIFGYKKIARIISQRFFNNVLLEKKL